MTARNVNPGLIYLENSYILLSNSTAHSLTSNGYGACMYGYQSVIDLENNEFNNYYPNCFYLVESSIFMSYILVNHSNTKISTVIMISCKIIHLESSIFSNKIGIENGALFFQYQNIYINSSNFIISDCKFINNSVSLNGGAILIQDATVNIFDSLFFYNRAGYGGALYFKTTSYDFNLKIFNTNFTKNTALFEGGAIKYNYNLPIIPSDVIFSENYALYGKNIASYPVRMSFIVSIKRQNFSGY